MITLTWGSFANGCYILYKVPPMLKIPMLLMPLMLLNRTHIQLRVRQTGKRATSHVPFPLSPHLYILYECMLSLMKLIFYDL